MSKLSNYLENALINEVLRNTNYAPASPIYLALYTSDPTDADSGVEVSGTSYARQAITFNAPSNGVCTSAADVTFPVAGGAWGTITHFGIRDALTSGNLLVYGALTASKVINSGDQIKFVAGSVSVTFD